MAVEWGYYTDQLQNNTSIPVTWKLEQDGSFVDITTITANKGRQSEDLNFIPSIYSTDEHPIYLCAYYGARLLTRIPTKIQQSTLAAYETPVYDIKMSAYGKTNQSTDKAVWRSADGTVQATFSNAIRFDDNSGWNNNALRVSGTSQYVTIPYNAFSGTPSNGRTIEFEFEPEKVDSTDDILIVIGNPTGARIEVKANTATLYKASGEEKIHTNFKSNERIKLAFIINEQNNEQDSGLLFIVNNGILERAAIGGEEDFSADSG